MAFVIRCMVSSSLGPLSTQPRRSGAPEVPRQGIALRTKLCAILRLCSYAPLDHWQVIGATINAALFTGTLAQTRIASYRCNTPFIVLYPNRNVQANPPEGFGQSHISSDDRYSRSRLLIVKHNRHLIFTNNTRSFNSFAHSAGHIPPSAAIVCVKVSSSKSIC